MTKYECPQCGKSFATKSARGQHKNAVHDRSEAARDRHKARCQRGGRDHEPSMADLVVQARIDAMSGEHVEDWLGDMFPDDIYGE